MMRYLLPFLFLLSTVAADTKPAIEVEKKLVVPAPGNLQANWWHFFQNDNFTESKGEFLERLGEVQAQLTPEQKEEVAPLIRKILVNLDALPKLKEQEVEPPVEKPFAEVYTLKQQIALAVALRQLQTQLNTENKELIQSKASVVKFRGHVDDLTAIYLKMDPKTYPRYRAGVELIAFRFALAITEQKLRLLDQRVDFLRTQVVHLKQEVSYATERLDLGDVNRAELANELANTQQMLKERRQDTLQAELALVGTVGDSPIDRARVELLLLQALKAQLQESLALSEVLSLRFKLNFVRAATAFQELDQEKFRLQLSEGSASLDELQEKTRDYQRALDAGLDKLGAPPADEGELSEQEERLELLREQRYDLIQEMVPEVERLRSKISVITLVEKNTYNLVRSKRSAVENWWTESYNYISDCCSTALSWMNKSLFKISGVPVTSIDLLNSFFVLVAAYLFSLFVRKGISKFASKHKRITKASVFIVNRVLHYIILLIGLFAALSTLGLDLNSVFLFIGALSVGIGFGLQSIVNNFVCSLILIFTRNIKVGDYIKLSTGEWGNVSAVNVQNTIIRDWDGVDIVVPNSALVANRFDNWTRKDPYKRLHVPFSVAYGTDKDKVVEAALKAAERVPCTIANHAYLDNPKVWFVHFGASSLDFELVVWYNIYSSGHKGSVRSSYSWELESALREYEIEVPFPQRDLHIKSSEIAGRLESQGNSVRD